MKRLKLRKTLATQSAAPDYNAAQTPFIATVEHARSFFARLRGLLGRPRLAAGCGLLISPCSQVHTLGMRFPIDVIFLDHKGVVQKLVHSLQPGRFSGVLGAKYAIELAENSIDRHGLQIGDQLEWQEQEKNDDK